MKNRILSKKPNWNLPSFIYFGIALLCLATLFLIHNHYLISDNQPQVAHNNHYSISKNQPQVAQNTYPTQSSPNTWNPLPDEQQQDDQPSISNNQLQVAKPSYSVPSYSDDYHAGAGNPFFQDMNSLMQRSGGRGTDIRDLPKDPEPPVEDLYEYYDHYSGIIFGYYFNFDGGYYRFIRIVIFMTTTILAYKNFSLSDKSLWPYLFTIIAIVFNPIYQIHLDGNLSNAIATGNIVIFLGIVFLFLAYQTRKVDIAAKNKNKNEADVATKAIAAQNSGKDPEYVAQRASIIDNISKKYNITPDEAAKYYQAYEDERIKTEISNNLKSIIAKKKVTGSIVNVPR